MLALSFSGFDPTETLPIPQGVDDLPVSSSVGWRRTSGARRSCQLWQPDRSVKFVASVFLRRRFGKGTAMKLHANAQTCPHCRSLIVSRVMAGQPAASVARDFQVSPKTALKWTARFRAQGRAGLDDRTSRPHHIARSHLQPGNELNDGRGDSVGLQWSWWFSTVRSPCRYQTTRARRLEVAEKNNNASRSWPYSHGGIRQLEIATLLSYISLVDPDLFGQFSVFLIECRAQPPVPVEV